jgi:hypothetical protein
MTYDKIRHEMYEDFISDIDFTDNNEAELFVHHLFKDKSPASNLPYTFFLTNLFTVDLRHTNIAPVRFLYLIRHFVRKKRPVYLSSVSLPFQMVSMIDQLSVATFIDRNRGLCHADDALNIIEVCENDFEPNTHSLNMVRSNDKTVNILMVRR